MHDGHQHGVGGGQDFAPRGIGLILKGAQLGVLLFPDGLDLVVKGSGGGAEGIRAKRGAPRGQVLFLFGQLGLDPAVFRGQFGTAVGQLGVDRLAGRAVGQQAFTVENKDGACRRAQPRLGGCGRILRGGLRQHGAGRKAQQNPRKHEGRPPQARPCGPHAAGPVHRIRIPTGSIR